MNIFCNNAVRLYGRVSLDISWQTSPFAGLIILASAIAGTRYRRIREVVVPNTLGTTRSRIAAIFSVEFPLGLVASLVGLLFANASSIFLLRKLELDYHFMTLENLLASSASQPSPSPPAG